MKPNDEALTEALAVFKNMLDPDDMRRALTAAYAAQFKSEDYAGLVKQLRFIDEDTLNIEPYSCEQLCKSAADALEALLAEREAWKRQAEICKDSLQETEITLGKYVQENDSLKAELASGHMWIQARATVLEELAMIRAERDALAARLAPVEDEALVEIAAEAISTYVPDQVSKWGSIKDAAIDAIAAIRPHIEAAERERCAKIADKYEGEWHSDTADACARAIAAAIRSGKS